MRPRRRFAGMSIRSATLRCCEPPAAVPKKRRKDMLAILQTEGFDAIQALGGYVHLATDDYEMLHRTQIYAPPLAGAAARSIDRSARAAGISQLRRMGMAHVGAP